MITADTSEEGYDERDDDEGELCYNFSKDIPDQPHDELCVYIKEVFRSETVEVRKRSNKQDSVEIYKGEEFLGVLYDDEGSQEDGEEEWLSLLALGLLLESMRKSPFLMRFMISAAVSSLARLDRKGDLPESITN